MSSQFIPHRLLEELAQENPDHPMVVFVDDRVYSARELFEGARQVASALQADGREPGERIALMAGNRFEFLTWWFGTAMAGLVSVPLNIAMRGEVLQHMLKLSAPSLVVAESELAEFITAAVPQLGNDRILTLHSDSDTGTVAKFLKRGKTAHTPFPAQPSTFASIMFTSGTTGPSKGVMWSHRMTMGKAESAIHVMGYTSEDVIFTCLPLFHSNALATAFVPALVVKARLVVAPRFSASNFWSMINDSGATTTNLLGSMASLLWSREPSALEKNHRLRKVLVAAVPGSFEEFESRFDLQCTQLYGLTDCGIPIGVPADVHKPESCGQALPDWEVQVVDEFDQPVPAGTVGEMVLRPRVPFISQLGYYGMPEATLAAWRNLWMHTGDLVRQDPDGWFYFVDRAKDAIRRSGENISAFEVEQALLAHDSVADAAAFAVPSEHGEDEVMVTVVLADGPDIAPNELVTWCLERLPYFAVPRYIDIVDELPRTETSKVRKEDLRAAGVTAATYDAGPIRRSTLSKLSG